MIIFLRIPIFSLAILVSLSLKNSYELHQIGVIIEHKELCIMLVASYFPPKPVSNNTRSESILENAKMLLL